MLGAVDLQRSSDKTTMPPHVIIESLLEKYPLDQGPNNFVEPLAPNNVVKDDDSDLIQPVRRHSAVVKRQATIDDSTTPKPKAESESNGDLESKTSSDDLKCNSEELRQLMLANIGETTSNSKRSINDKAEEQFGGSVDVICSKGHFSYVYSSNLYCEATKGDITCIAFRQSPPGRI
uniref:Ground-like domain-containing protein n=1 Tax=Ascaris lumbricoides TaxID=6252 RepID=A0A0M3INC6_ASCLU